MASKNEILKPFGPTILKSVIDDDIFDSLLEAVETSIKNKVTPPQYLAGEFNSGANKDLKFTSDDKFNKFLNWIKDKAADYGRAIDERHLVNMSNQLTLPILWVNYQKAGDFNPIHTHSGLISFIMYIKIPEYNNEQRYAGDINWRYGEQLPLVQNALNLSPKEKELYMFPAWLDHYVWPFINSNETRISIAGNLFLN
jgi:hypothetical protein